MKFNKSIVLIFTGSFIVFCLIYLALNKSSPVISESKNKLENKSQEFLSQKPEIQEKTPEKIKAPDLDEHAVELIQAVAALSEEELSKELSSLRERLKEENLFSKLEQGVLDGQKKAEAKALIERYTLLGLEGTRRKYLPIEPELKDPLYAHRDSLKDIRKLIDRY